MSTKNWPLLIETTQFIIDHPEQWDQQIWANVCGTAYCFAGHASLLAGSRQVQNREFADWDPDDEIMGRFSANWTHYVIVPESLESVFRTSEDVGKLKNGNRAFPMDEVAMVALGLDEGDCRLFDGDNSIADLLDYLYAWAAQDNVELPAAWEALR